MNYHRFRALAIPVVAVGASFIVAAAVEGQSRFSETAGRPADVPPTAWGDPDRRAHGPLPGPHRWSGRMTLKVERHSPTKRLHVFGARSQLVTNNSYRRRPGEP